jgi:hypothetical protein
MPFVDSRLGPGTLTLGTVPAEHGAQIAALALTPAVNSTDGTPTLAVPAPEPEMKTDYTLDGSAINDFAAISGLQRYAYDHDGETVGFVWTPSTPDAATLTGEVQLRAFPMGGKVGEQLVTDFSWPCVGKPAWAGGAAVLEAAGAGAAGGKRAR